MKKTHPKEKELLYKQVSRHYLQSLLVHLKENRQENKSFIYLENDTLHTLLLLLLKRTNLEYDNLESRTFREHEEVPKELLDELTNAININKKYFEEIIEHIKKVSY
ncbi:hypothetical protein ACERII_06560 [Evansella sp. AB-rgal1]|uniref:hypothetical protein n=1 Tax=Evansella sp. AB-rgal1 TaxID=3242696 RepID=UPI00359E0522